MLSRIALALLLMGLASVAVSGMRIAEGLHRDWGHPGYLLQEYESYLPDEVMVNSPGSPCGTEYLVTSISDSFDSATDYAVTNWNNALRNYDPSRLTKYVFHKNSGYDDPSPCVNIKVWGLDSATHARHCGSATAHGCLEDDNQPDDTSFSFANRPLWAIMNEGDLTFLPHKVSDLAHELGHALVLGEHGGTSYNCESIMGHSYGNCGTIISSPTEHDRYDFYAAYKPQDSANPTGMQIDSSSRVTFGWSTAQTDNHTGFWWTKETDAPGSQLAYGVVARNTTSVNYLQLGSLSNGSRWCVRVNPYTEAGFPGLLPFGPSSKYGCVDRETGPSAGGPFVATTHRLPNGKVRINVKNYSSGTRYMNVTGSNLANIGCPWNYVARNAQYQCDRSLSVGQYTHLEWWAWTGSNVSYGRVDYD